MVSDELSNALFSFLHATTSSSQVTRGILNNPSPHQVVENPEADQGTG